MGLSLAVNDAEVETILTRIKSLPPTSPHLQAIVHHLKDYSLLLPMKSIFIKGSSISWNKKILNLKKKEKILAIFSTFLDNKKIRIDSSTLIQEIYGVNAQQMISSRRLECLNHNIVKLISRSRQLATTHLSPHNKHEVDWFPYDPHSKTWILIRTYYKKPYVNE